MSDLDDLLKNLDHIPDLTLAECNAFIPLLDSLLIELAYVSHIEKAARDPLTEKGFIALEQLLANKLDKLSYNEKRKALRRIAAAAKVTDFSALTAEKQAEFIGLVQNTFRDYGLATSKLISGQITDSMLDMFKRTRTVMSKDLPIEDFFTVQDTRAIGYMANTQSFWIRQHFQNDKTQAMNDVVAKQLEQFGGSREDVADALIARLGRDLGDKNYWTVVSSATLNTSRSYSSLRAYQDAGIQRYEIVAMMDERTSTVCKLMNGRIFEVSVSLEVFSKLQSAESPDKYKEIKPWASPYMTDEGTVAYKAGNFRFDDSVTDAALAKHNFTFPPFHGRCRTRVVAEFIQKYFIMKNCR